MTHLTAAHDGIPPYAYGIAALVAIAAAGVAIALVARTARRAALRLVDCCPHPDLDDEEPQPAGVTS